MNLENKRWDVLPIFNCVITDGHPIFWVSRHPPRLQYWMPIHYDKMTILYRIKSKTAIFYLYIVNSCPVLHPISTSYLRTVATTYIWLQCRMYTWPCYRPGPGTHTPPWCYRPQTSLLIGMIASQRAVFQSRPLPWVPTNRCWWFLTGSWRWRTCLAGSRWPSGECCPLPTFLGGN